jgi:hypothetical protein
MNTAAPQLLGTSGRLARTGSTLIAWRDAIAALGPTPWKWAGGIALFGATLQSALIIGEIDRALSPPAPTPLLVMVAICWTVQVTLGLCAWAIADRFGVAPERRPMRLAIALGVAVLLSALIVPALSGLLVGHVNPCVWSECEHKDFSKVPWWLMQSEDSGHMLAFGALIYAWLEMHHRNREIEQRLLASQQQRARLLRTAFDSRLTAMRAQVDPQFLFDSLADVQAAYATNTSQGTATLDRLIVYLRTALPGLRAEGSTVAAEGELLGAWLAVLAARRGGCPAWSVDVDPDCNAVPFPATVLLPLVQWAVGEPEQAAQTVALSVRRLGGRDSKRLRALLRVQPGQPCNDEEPAPRRVRERLQELYGDAAALSCRTEEGEQSGPGQSGPGAVSTLPATLISVTWPDEGADRDHR